MRHRCVLAQHLSLILIWLVRAGVMRILFDHGTPVGIAESLAGHEVTQAIERGWDRVANGELLKLAEAEGFDHMLTTDKSIRYQQNLAGRKIGIVVLGNSTWRVVRFTFGAHR